MIEKTPGKVRVTEEGEPTSDAANPIAGSTSIAGIKESAPKPAVQSQVQSYRKPATERTLLPVVPSMPNQEGSTTSSQGSDRRRTSPTAREMTNSGLHSPSNLPPVPYDSPTSPWKPKQPRKHSKDIEPVKLGHLMNRMDRLEEAVEKYVDERGKAALKKSVIPGLEEQKESAKEGSNKPSQDTQKKH